MFTITTATVTTPAAPLTYWLHRPPAPPADAPSILLLTFSSTRQASFHEAPYNLPAQLFAEAGHAVASFDLPNHGEQINAYGEGIVGMCAAFCAGADPFRQFIAQSQAVIDACLAQGIGTGGIVACGVSRAGYCALRLAAADPRVHAVAGLAPVVDWRPLREFALVREEPAVAALALTHWATALAGRPVFMSMGNNDLRVSSAACVELGRRLLEIEEAAQATASALELYIVPSAGHALADAWRLAGAQFLLRHCGRRSDK
ncbi:MAG: hypothetical protein KF832_06005 [Caldilineaceae bacterium]|nr:hypothetical protein [Caldilineaceae bacterium]